MTHNTLQEIHVAAVDMYQAKQRHEYLLSNRKHAQRKDIRNARRTLRAAEKLTQRKIAKYVEEQTNGPRFSTSHIEDHLARVRQDVSETLKQAERNAMLKDFTSVVENI